MSTSTSVEEPTPRSRWWASTVCWPRARSISTSGCRARPHASCCRCSASGPVPTASTGRSRCGPGRWSTASRPLRAPRRRGRRAGTSGPPSRRRARSRDRLDGRGRRIGVQPVRVRAAAGRALLPRRLVGRGRRRARVGPVRRVDAAGDAVLRRGRDRGRRRPLRRSRPAGTPRPRPTSIEPDASSASYLFAAAAIVRRSGPRRRTGRGARGRATSASSTCSGRWAPRSSRGSDHTEVRGTGTLHGIDVDLADMPDMAQTLAAVAVFADGPTTVRGVGLHPWPRDRSHRRGGHRAAAVRHRRDRDRRRLRGPARRADSRPRSRPTTTTAWP